MQRNYDFILKLVIIGSSSVGKSSILKRFADDQFQQSYISTIGIDFRFKSLMINDLYVKLQIYDTAGQQRFRGITKSYYKGAHAVIFVFDVNSQKSFQDIVQYWYNQSKTHAPESIFFIFGNKCDDQKDHLTSQQEKFISQKQMTYCPVSAKTGFGVTKAILQIAKKLMETVPSVTQKKGLISLEQQNLQSKKQTKKCCKN